MTTPTGSDPAWKAIVDAISGIDNQHARDVAAAAICDAYGLGIFRGAVRAGTSEPTNTHERPEDAARRFATQLERLQNGLAQRGIPLLDRPVDEAPVDTALAVIDELRAHPLLGSALGAIRSREFRVALTALAGAGLLVGPRERAVIDAARDFYAVSGHNAKAAALFSAVEELHALDAPATSDGAHG